MTISKKDRLEIIQNILNGFEEYWIDSKGVIQATNLEATAITGYEEAEIIGKHFSLLYIDEEISNNQPMHDLAQALEVGSLRTKGVRLRKNKTKFIAKIRFEATSKENGETGVKMILQDTTYSAIQNHKLKQVESHYNSLFHNRFIGVLNLDDHDFKILLANVKGCETLQEYDFTNKYFIQYIKENDSLERFQEIVDAEDDNDFELRLTTAAGECWVRMRCCYFPIEGIIEVLLFDISEEKKRIAELEKINQHLDQFIYHASHDLRSPLTTLLGLLYLSRNELDSIESIHTYVDLMIERTQHLDRLLSNLAAIAYNEKAEIDLDKIQFDHEIKSVLDEHKEINPAICAISSVLQRTEFVTDARRLRTILRNMVSNAYHYFNPGQSTPYVKLSVNIEADRAVIVIDDNGIGIHPFFKEKVFTMFFRGTDRSTGSGLGLYIAKVMTEKLGGDITVNSIPEKGSSFTIILPNKKSEAKRSPIL